MRISDLPGILQHPSIVNSRFFTGLSKIRLLSLKAGGGNTSLGGRGGAYSIFTDDDVITTYAKSDGAYSAARRTRGRCDSDIGHRSSPSFDDWAHAHWGRGSAGAISTGGAAKG